MCTRLAFALVTSNEWWEKQHLKHKPMSGMQNQTSQQQTSPKEIQQITFELVASSIVRLFSSHFSYGLLFSFYFGTAIFFLK